MRIGDTKRNGKWMTREGQEQSQNVFYVKKKNNINSHTTHSVVNEQRNNNNKKSGINQVNRHKPIFLAFGKMLSKYIYMRCELDVSTQCTQQSQKYKKKKITK